jgi:AbrB family transcriptional regulator (stage V sporulation protein T)
MLNAGIVRRIDELGRVVIPKEIRKTLRIREGDPLEIFTDNDQLIFRKHSPLTLISAMAETVGDGIKKLTEKACLITDNDTVIYVSSSRNKDLLGKYISEELIKTINRRKSVVLSKKDGQKNLPLTMGGGIMSEGQIIVPIVSGGDCYGSVVTYIDNQGEFNSTDLRLTEMGALMLSRQFI